MGRYKLLAEIGQGGFATVYRARNMDLDRLVALKDLDSHLLANRGCLPWPEAIEMISAVAERLDYAHQDGILHRDLKPANILIDPGRGPLLSDFGPAKLVEENSLSRSRGGGWHPLLHCPGSVGRARGHTPD